MFGDTLSARINNRFLGEKVLHIMTVHATEILSQIPANQLVNIPNDIVDAPPSLLNQLVTLLSVDADMKIEIDQNNPDKFSSIKSQLLRKSQEKTSRLNAAIQATNDAMVIFEKQLNSEIDQRPAREAAAIETKNQAALVREERLLAGLKTLLAHQTAAIEATEGAEKSIRETLAKWQQVHSHTTHNSQAVEDVPKPADFQSEVGKSINDLSYTPTAL